MFSPLSHDDPERLGDYGLLARLGTGGMGTVYLGRSSEGRVAALKTLHTRTAADPAFRTRFRLETDAARVIGGRYGAQVFDADPAAETPWLATEYVIGPPLDEAVRVSGPFPEAAVRALGALLCEALAQLHRSDVVHRDLKPSNIMVTAVGPKVIDFGIAHAIGDERLTRTGTAAGTPAFMSPEQAMGTDHTPAGDVFALAGVLVYAATGRGPFGAGQAADLLYRVRYAAPDLTGVPAGLLPVLRRCLEKEPEKRPTTADLRAELAAPQAKGHVTSEPGPITAAGAEDFAALLPQPVLAEIAQRATAVWQVEPRRLAAPADVETVPLGSPRMSRRRLLTVAAGTAFGIAAAGSGVWAWADRRRGGAPVPAPATADGSQPKWNLVWQVAASYTDPRVPPAPFLLDGLVVVGAFGMRGLEPRTGKALWPDYPDAYFAHLTATDGRQLYTVDHATELTPLTVSRVDPATGATGDPFIELEDYRAALYGTQALCATADMIYAVAGQGAHPADSTEHDHFYDGQSWYLLGLDVRSAQKLWEVPLPARPNGSTRMYVLSAQVSGDRLVLVQQSADGGTELAVHDRHTGRALWRRGLDGGLPPDSRAHLAVDDERVYPSSGRLQALNLRDGTVAWQYQGSRTGAAYGPPTVADGVVYALEEGRGLVALDAASGAPRWTEDRYGATAADLATPPVVGFAYVYRQSPAGLVATDIRKGAGSRPVKAARAEHHYFAHRPSRRLIALGANYAAAYPLL
ncbi:PQQ-binding-like beta-propeller repeat protein [Streptomyces sp. NPDC085995]|uniref:protein kinase domain-containing protein n=1 Tax=Streptomyces sp. NPDC085995 TaxID=3154861 RepID=UPI0034313BB2